jgi:hypothetical protein
MKVAELLEAKSETSFDVSKIMPDAKDYARAEGLRFRGSTFYGNRSPFGSEAAKQAKLIKDKTKLVRRAKAVVAEYGIDPHTGYSQGKPVEENVWKPFEDALRNMGITRDEMKSIMNFSKPQ